MKVKNMAKRSRQSGFTIVETVISMAILTIGSLGLLGVFGVAVKASQSTQQDMIARQLASEAIESIYTARNSSQISWNQIQNISNGGIFLNGFNNIMCAGPDGIIGTANDTSCLSASGATCPNGGIRCLNEPGRDGIMGTPDDVTVSLLGYQRQVLITPLKDTAGNPIQTLNQIAITIQYTPPGTSFPKTYVVNEYISAYH